MTNLIFSCNISKKNLHTHVDDRFVLIFCNLNDLIHQHFTQKTELDFFHRKALFTFHSGEQNNK